MNCLNSFKTELTALKALKNGSSRKKPKYWNDKVAERIIKISLQRTITLRFL